MAISEYTIVSPYADLRQEIKGVILPKLLKESPERRTVISENQGVMEWVTCPGIREGK